MVPYRQGRAAAVDSFKLSSNENPFEPLPAVLEAIAASSVNRYPDGAATALRSALAAHYALAPENVHIGAGSASILSQLITAAAGPGDEVVYSWRSFEAYPGFVTVAGATSVAIPNTADHRHDLPAMAAAVTERTRVVIVCSPNNPTGSVVTADEFADFMTTIPETVLVLLDEAYIEFVTDATAVRGPELLARYSNLVVLRTFSKAFGLAGLRVGYALGAEYVLDAARASAIPLSVIESAQRAAIVSLEHLPQLLERVARLAELRDSIWQALVEQGWQAPRPHGNFIWLPTLEHTAWAAEVFADNGIVVRALGSDGLRVSIGEHESVEKLLKASQEVVRKLRTEAGEATLD
ncbi:MAG: hisC [Microbacteriaceae bacterium]|jgi:histidinol-phosphate aminotransferase|nr:hisC [Microbacteriaceae bacterium]